MTMMKPLALSIGAALFLYGSHAFAAGMLTDSKGMTLYMFDADKGMKSMCNGDCAKHWPPYLVMKGENMGEGWGKIKRGDGKMQWTYDKHPLYYYDDDKKAGDMMGDGKGGKWHVIKS